MSDKKSKAEKVAKKYHKNYKGKIYTELKVPVNEIEDFSIYYTPGVAEPCKDISENKERVYDYTNKANTIAIISDGSRVLGLGKIGPEAGLPVMEGKALLFRYLGGVDAYPICIDTDDEDEIVETVNRLTPSFGGINLEDLESPKCFSILSRLREDLNIPVWHDDQQGTALVTTAALLGALKVVDKKIDEIKLVFVGAGAAGVNNAKYAIKAGAKPKNILMVDSKGILSTERGNINRKSYKYEWAEKTNSTNLEGGKKLALKDADVCIAASTPGPGTIKKEEIGQMTDEAIVFATANPTPEIMPAEAKKAGARIVGTGRSDFPNQINNSLGFPAVFRGALEVAATDITDEMCISAAYAIAERAEEVGLSDDFVIPTMDDLEMYVQEAVAVAEKAREKGVARKSISRRKLEENIKEKLTKPKKINEILKKEGIIQGIEKKP